MQQSLDLVQKGDLLGAIQQAEELTKQYPHYSPAQCLLGDLYLRIGSPMLAIEPLEKAVHTSPEYPLPRFLLGCALGRLGEFQRALDHLFIADRLKPNDAEIIRNIDWMKCMSGKVKEGRSCLRQSIKLDPKNGLAYNDLGARDMDEKAILVMSNLHNWVKSQRCFSSYRVLVHVSSYMFTQDLNLQLAERWLKKALELGPNNAFIQNTWQSFQQLFYKSRLKQRRKNQRDE